MQPYDTYEPLLNSFYNSISNPNLNKDFSSVFVPNVFDRYYETEKKIFYLGRDTNEWETLSQVFNNWNPVDITNRTKDFLENFEFLTYNKERKATFWDVVIRLHLKLKGIDTADYSLAELKEKYAENFDFGYGNTNAFETMQTLQRINTNYDKIAYQRIKKASLPFDKLSNIIKAFEPKLVVVMHWAIDESLYLDGYDFEYIQDGGLFNERFLCIKLNIPSDTHVLWIQHPNYLKFHFDTVDIINSLADYIRIHSLI